MIATVTGTERDTSFRSPGIETDALSFNIAALKRNTIEHFVPMKKLVALTRAAVFLLSGQGGITAANIDVEVASYNGANFASPAVTDDTVFYAASLPRGRPDLRRAAGSSAGPSGRPPCRR